jgi:SOS-response transcriptional repressor LexA
MRKIEKQSAVLDYIVAHPGASLREIMRDCNLSSTSVASTQVDKLIERGVVKREWGLSRTIRAVPNFVNSKGERWFDVTEAIIPTVPTPQPRTRFHPSVHEQERNTEWDANNG